MQKTLVAIVVSSLVGTALGEVSVQRSGEKVVATVDGKKIFEYQAEAGRLPRANIKPAFLRGGFIHPIFTPAGKIISDSYATNHLHQHGIWFAWTKTEFEGRQPDFWNMGEGKGKVEFVAVDKIWSGATEGGFVARHRYIDLTSGQPKPVLNETWEVKVYKGPGRSPSANMFDLICTQECATTNRLKLPQYYYGGLGFRGREEWNGPTQTLFLTSEGETDRVKGNETRARWCWVGGDIDGGRVGVAILSHPKNFRAPQPVRLHPKEPFFCYAPSQLGDWEIAPGEKYISRYRYVVSDGPPDRAAIDRWWDEFAKTAK
jgi:hypothetical protein